MGQIEAFTTVLLSEIYERSEPAMKRIFMSAIALAVAILGMATFIYAWFTKTTTPRAGEFSMQATTLEGLEIALDKRLSAGDFDNTLGNLNNFSRLSYKPYIFGEEIADFFDNAFANDIMLVPSQAGGGAGLGAGKAFSGLDSSGGAAQLSSSERRYVEFTLYFRTEAERLQSERDVVLDMTDYSGEAASGDIRSYVTGAGSSSFFLPLEWIGTPYELVNAQLNIKDYIIVGANNKILGINMFKYNNPLNSEGVFVDPKNGNFCANIPYASFTGLDDSFMGEYIWTDISAGTILDKYSNMQAIGGRINLASLGYAGYEAKHYTQALGDELIADGIGVEPVSVYACTADTLRLSFSQIDNNNAGGGYQAFNNRVDISSGSPATIWNPRAGAGRYAGDSVVSNFALHMLLATDGLDLGSISGVDAYLASHQADISSAPLCTLGTERASHGGYCYGATTIRVWIEGWDSECLNSIMQNIASISLQFKLV